MNGLIKLKVPNGFHMMTLGGRVLEADEFQAVWVLPTEVDELKSHGFLLWEGDASSASVEDMGSVQLRNEIMNRTSASLNGLSLEELRTRLRALPLPSAEPVSTGVVTHPEKIDMDYIMSLGHAALVDYCKRAGLRVHSGFSKASLRDLAVGTLKPAEDDPSKEPTFDEFDAEFDPLGSLAENG